MRPIGSTKERLPIYENEFKNLITLVNADAKLNSQTWAKLLRAYTLLYFTGCRVSEISELKTDDLTSIITSRSLCLDGHTKTKKPRTIFFNEAMVKVISCLPKDDCLGKNAYLFYAPGDTLYIPRAMNKFSLTELLNKYLDRYLGPLYTTHSFRAGYITRIVEATGNLKTAQDMVGHGSIKTTIRYLSTSKEQKFKALDRVFK